jgi:hypothetical protein
MDRLIIEQIRAHLPTVICIEAVGNLCWAEVKGLLQRAEGVDRVEDKKYGIGVRGDEIPTDLRFKQGRIEKIEEAKAALEDNV